jgi:predicted RNA binding protein YcfA (HicA-like mRNA interferase family)
MKVRDLIRRLEAVTLAGKLSLDIPPGTLNAILKQAGLGKER